MNKYFKFQSDSDLGVGIQYIEFSENGWAIRQAECYGNRWFNSNQSYHQQTGSMGLCDQQLTEAGMKLGDLINAEEFELAWNLSNRELVSSHYLRNNESRKKEVIFILKFVIALKLRPIISFFHLISNFRLDRSSDEQRIDSAESETDSTL